MPLPGTWNNVTVTATFLRADTGGPAAGAVVFAPQRGIGIDDTVVLPNPITATLNGSGQITASLPCPDDAGAGFTTLVYKVIERIPFGREYFVQLDNTMTAEVLGDLDPLTDDQAAYYSFRGPPGPEGDVTPEALAAQAAAEAAAGAASASATAADGSADAAAASAAAASGSANAAAASIATGAIYPDTATGLAAVGEGGYFSVPSPDSDEYLILYRDVAGVATEIKRYPSAARVAAIEALVDENAGTSAAHVFADEADNALMVIESDGSLRVAGLDIPVQEAVEFSAREAGDIEAAHVFEDNTGKALGGIRVDGEWLVPRVGALQSNLIGPEVITAFEYDALGDTARRNMYLDVAKYKFRPRVAIRSTAFGYNEGGSGKHRQPFVLPLTPTTGIVFCGQQVGNAVGGSENGQRLVCRDYTVDFTTGVVTYSSIRIIEAPPLIAEGKGQITDPKAIVIPSGPNAGRIVLTFHRDEHAEQVTSGPGSENRFYRQWFTYSDDNGITWPPSAPVAANPDPQSYGFASAGQIVRIPTGPYAGRLVQPIWKAFSMVACIYSDNDGTGWAMGAWHTITGTGSGPFSEVSIAWRSQLEDLVVFARNDASGGYLGKAQLTSADGGANLVFVGMNTELAFSNSNMALLNTNIDLTPEFGFPRYMAGCTANPAYYERTKYRIRLSYDECERWPAEWAPFPDRQGVGYSQLAQIDPETFVLTHEVFNDSPGDINTENSVQLYFFNLAEVMANVSYPSL